MKLRRGDVLENKNTIMDRLNETDIAKYTIKDSVFTNLFQDKKYRVWRSGWVQNRACVSYS